jgi:hypothetical protein
VRGIGDIRDLKVRVEYCQRWAEQRSIHGRYFLGLCHEFGNWVKHILVYLVYTVMLHGNRNWVLNLNLKIIVTTICFCQKNSIGHLPRRKTLLKEENLDRFCSSRVILRNNWSNSLSCVVLQLKKGQ